MWYWLLICDLIIPIVMLISGRGPVKIHAQIYLQAPAE